MPLWKLRPIAEAHDPRWQGRRIWREAVVRARTAAEARLVAATLDRRSPEPPNGNESESFRSGFVDEKLYRVDWVGEADGPAEVLQAVEGPPSVLLET